MEAMRLVPTEQILRHTVSESANDCYEPAINRCASVKPMSSMEALVAGNVLTVPVLLGVTENDGLGKSELEQTMFRDVRSRAELEELFRRDFGEKASEVLVYYWPKEVEAEARAVHQSLSLFSNDLWYFAGTYLMGKLITSSSPVYLYCFAGAKRSMHGSDMASWRGAAKSKLSHVMSRYLGNFARYGNPNGNAESSELPSWKCMSEAPDDWMFLDSEPAMKEIDATKLRWYNFLATEYFSKSILQKVNACSDVPASKRMCIEKDV